MKCTNPACGKDIHDAYYRCKSGTFCSDGCHELFHPKYYAKKVAGIDEKYFPFCISCRREGRVPVEGYDHCLECLQSFGLKVKVEAEVK